ncbi:HEAT repeat domain-containing protein [bacterium]|nr:HEAT repeat domain-containing protein [bacterium]
MAPAPPASSNLREERMSREDKVRLIADNLFHPEVERRLAAIRSVGGSRDPWLCRLLLYKTADAERAVAKEAEAALRERGADLTALYLAEMHSPHVDVRAAAVRLLGQVAELEHLPQLCRRLFDYHVSVRDAARTALRRVVERNRRTADDPAARRLVARALALFGDLCGSLDMGARHLALDLMLQFGRFFPDQFWDIYLRLDERRRKLLHLELLRHKTVESTALIYRGMCHSHPEIAAAMARLIFNNMDQEDFNVHLEVAAGLPAEEQRRVAELYREHQILPKLLRIAGWLRQNARLMLIRLLGYLEAMQFRDFFVDCLNLTDRETRLAILRIGEQYPLEIPREKLLQLLREGDSELTVGVCAYLEARGTFEMVRDVTPFFSSDEERVRRAALAAVFRISRDYLLDRYDRLKPSARADLARFLLKMNERFAEELVARLDAMEEDERLRNVEIVTLIADEPRVRRVLEALLAHPDEKVRATATAALANLVGDDKLAVLRPLLSDPDSRVRANAIQELPDDAADAEIRALLAESARSEHNRERANAISKLLAMGAREHESDLLEMLESPDPWVRASGLWALSRSRAPDLLSHARAGLSDPSPAVRRMALLALGVHAPVDEVRGFTHYLADGDASVRRAARDVLRDRLKIDYEVAP